jgi:hypothetical protein
MIVKTKIPEI